MVNLYCHASGNMKCKFGKNVNVNQEHIKSESKKTQNFTVYKFHIYISVCVTPYHQFWMQLYLLRFFAVLLNNSEKANVTLFCSSKTWCGDNGGDQD